MSAFTSFIRPAVTAFVIPVAGCVTRDLAAVTPPLARGGYDTIAVVADAADPVAWRARGVSRVVHVSGPDSSSDSCIAAALLACRARGHPPGRVALLLDGDVSTPWPWSFSRGELVKSATRAGSQAVLLASPVPADLPPYTSATGPMIGLPSASLVDAVAGLVSGVHEGSPPYAFGPHGVPADHVFASSAHAYALVNLKPVTAGHALIVSRRAVPRFRDLAPAEVADLWSLAQAISAGLEARFDADAATIVLQDGAAAGQTVAHVHVHVLPRHVADLADNDEVYELVRCGGRGRHPSRSAQNPPATATD